MAEMPGELPRVEGWDEMQPVGTDTQGAIHCHQLKSLDWRVCKAKFKEGLPAVILDEVAARMEAILFG